MVKDRPAGRIERFLPGLKRGRRLSTGWKHMAPKGQESLAQPRVKPRVCICLALYSNPPRPRRRGRRRFLRDQQTEDEEDWNTTPKTDTKSWAESWSLFGAWPFGLRAVRPTLITYVHYLVYRLLNPLSFVAFKKWVVRVTCTLKKRKVTKSEKPGTACLL
jgi:hypothetical protein